LKAIFRYYFASAVKAVFLFITIHFSKANNGGAYRQKDQLFCPLPRIVAHKSTALACQNFMISMAAVGYDTCPMEGFDSLKLKRLLKLPYGAEISMVIACGIRTEEGIYWPQFRIPFEEVYHTK